MTNNKHQDVDRGTPKAGKTRSPKKPIKHVTLTEIKNKTKNKNEENFRWGSKKEERSLNDKWKSEVGVTAGWNRGARLSSLQTLYISASSLSRLGQANSWHTAVVTEDQREGKERGRQRECMETEGIVQSAQAQRDGGARAAMTRLHECEYLGGGAEMVTYGLVVHVRMGVWGLSRCSCHEWQSQRNRYTVHVFTSRRENERVPSFLPLHLNAHMTDDTMQKYGAYWTRLSVQKTLKSWNWWVGPQIQGNHYNNHGDINKHHPEQRLITVLVSKATSSHPTHHRETKTLKKTWRATVPARRNRSGHSHLRTLLLGKVKWCWTAVVSAQREWEGPAVFWRRQRSVQSNLRSHFVSANPRAGLWILMSSCCFCPAQQKNPQKTCMRQTRAGTNTRENFFKVSSHCIIKASVPVSIIRLL